MRWRESALCDACSEARLGPDRWELPIPSCLLRSRNAWKASLTAYVCSRAAMGRDIVLKIYFMQLSDISTI